MNALDRIFVNAGKFRAAARIVGAASTAALAAGCAAVHIAGVQVDPSSPVAPEVAKVAREAKTYPKFSDIPPAPSDVRPARQYGQRANELKAERAQLDAATAPGTWALSNTQGFASRARNQAGPDYGASTTSQTESFANTIRKRATPPPPTNP